MAMSRRPISRSRQKRFDLAVHVGIELAHVGDALELVLLRATLFAVCQEIALLLGEGLQPVETGFDAARQARDVAGVRLVGDEQAGDRLRIFVGVDGEVRDRVELPMRQRAAVAVMVERVIGDEAGGEHRQHRDADHQLEQQDAVPDRQAAQESHGADALDGRHSVPGGGRLMLMGCGAPATIGSGREPPAAENAAAEASLAEF